MRCEILTSDVVCPSSSSKDEKIVRENCDVESLVDEESMPSLNDERIVVEHNNTEDDLWNDYANTSADCNPSEYIHTTNRVALYHNQHPFKPIQHHKQPTKPREIFFGASIAVQWYCPPAVGYLADSSARLNAVAPIKNNIRTQP